MLNSTKVHVCYVCHKYYVDNSHNFCWISRNRENLPHKIHQQFTLIFFGFMRTKINEKSYFLNLHRCTIQRVTKNIYIYGKSRSNRQNDSALTLIFLCHWQNGTKFLFSAFCPHKSNYHRSALLNVNQGNETTLTNGKQGRIYTIIEGFS